MALSESLEREGNDVVSRKTHIDNRNMFIGNSRIDLPPEHLKSFRPARVSNRFQFVKAS